MPLRAPRLRRKLARRTSSSLRGYTLHVVVVLSGMQASRRSSSELSGRSDSNKKVVFPVPDSEASIKVGDYVSVLVESATALTLRGKMLARLSGPSIDV